MELPASSPRLATITSASVGTHKKSFCLRVGTSFRASATTGEYRVLPALFRLHVRLQRIAESPRQRPAVTASIRWPRLANFSAIVLVDLFVHRRRLIGSPAVVSSTIPTVRFLTSGSDFLDPPGYRQAIITT